MNRSQILWLQAWIALSGGVFWSLSPQLHHWKPAVVVSGIWGALCLASISLESLENWAHRISAFCGFLFCTIEGILGLLGLTTKSGLLLMATLHGCTFLLSVVGRYRSRANSRKRPTLAHLAIEDAERKDPFGA